MNIRTAGTNRLVDTYTAAAVLEYLLPSSVMAADTKHQVPAALKSTGN
jgi:hypothetical protein